MAISKLLGDCHASFSAEGGPACGGHSARNDTICFAVIVVFLFTSSFIPVFSASTNKLQQNAIIIQDPQTQIEIESIKQDISNLKNDVSDLKSKLSTLIDNISNLITNQNSFINAVKNQSKTFDDLLKEAKYSNQLNSFKDTAILNLEGKPVLFVDNVTLKIYEYGGGNLVGRLNPETKEVIRSYDDSVIAIVDNDFLIDEYGRPIGSLERSENLRWDREKLYSKVQKTPESHFFNRAESQKQFIPNQLRFSSWSLTKLEDLLFFSPSKVNKIK